MEETYTVDIMLFICEALCCTPKAHKPIDKIYNTNKQAYDKAAKESKYYEFASERNIEEESYFKKVLGILEFDEEDDNIIHILKMTYKKANQIVKNSNLVKVSSIIRTFSFDKMSVEEMYGSILSLILIAEHERKPIDTSEDEYNTFGRTLVMQQDFLYSDKELQYKNMDKAKRKRLREIQLSLESRYHNLRNYIPENELMNLETAEIEFNKLTEYQKNIYPINHIYTLEGLKVDSLVDGKLLTDTEMQELINCWSILNSTDNIDYDKLYGFMYPAIHIRYILKAYKRAKKYHFDNLNEDTVEKLEKANRELREVHQKNIQLQEENMKLKHKLETEIATLKEENRILENKNNQLEKQISEYPNITEELSQLRNLMFELNEDIIEEKVDIDIDEINNINAICFGGNESWTNTMKEILPNWKFIPAGANFDTALLKGKEYIFINTRANSHKIYYKITENKDVDTKLRFLNKSNKDKVLSEIKYNL